MKAINTQKAATSATQKTWQKLEKKREKLYNAYTWQERFEMIGLGLVTAKNLTVPALSTIAAYLMGDITAAIPVGTVMTGLTAYFHGIEMDAVETYMREASPLADKIAQLNDEILKLDHQLTYELPQEERE